MRFGSMRRPETVVLVGIGLGWILVSSASAQATPGGREAAPAGRSASASALGSASRERWTPVDLAWRAVETWASEAQAVWPDSPEGVAMFLDILRGSRLGPGEGWFKKGVAQTRYDWKNTSHRLDRDRNGRVDRGEFAGSDGDFARLDRDRDGALGAADFDFTPHALSFTPGMAAFLAADRDGDGKLTRQEWEAFFRASDRAGDGFVSLDEVRESIDGPPGGRRSSSRGPSRLTLIKGLFRQEIGSLQPGPAVGDRAPDFTLRTLDGAKEVTLSKRVGPRPVVLIFGNFTCGPFRMQAGNVEKLYRHYKDRADFVMVYVREAHPIDGWRMESNDREDVAIAQPRTFAERVAVARTCGRRLDLGMPMLVDTMDDTVGARYSGMPSRLYLIDHQGRVAYKSGRGPFGFKPAELEHSLLLLLQDEFPGLAPRETEGIGTAGLRRAE